MPCARASSFSKSAPTRIAPSPRSTPSRSWVTRRTWASCAPLCILSRRARPPTSSFTDADAITQCLADCRTILEGDPSAQIKLSDPRDPGFLYCRPRDPAAWLQDREPRLGAGPAALLRRHRDHGPVCGQVVRGGQRAPTVVESHSRVPHRLSSRDRAAVAPTRAAGRDDRLALPRAGGRSSAPDRVPRSKRRGGRVHRRVREAACVQRRRTIFTTSKQQERADAATATGTTLNIKRSKARHNKCDGCNSCETRWQR